MKRYSAAQARQHFSEMLDSLERGETVVVERRGIQLPLRIVRSSRRRPATQYFDLVDPAVESGQWSWDWSAGGALRFKSRRPKR